MDKECNRLIGEILLMVVFLVVIVPICVQASSAYRLAKEKFVIGENTSIDIINCGDVKKITISSDYDKPILVNLIFKISKFSDDYLIYLDDEVYDIRQLDYTEDTENQYYNLGIYEVDGSREFDFQLKLKDKSYYDETITYSFLTNGMI